MKKLFVCFFAFCAFSCSLTNDVQESFTEILPVETAVIPDEFVLGETYEITLTYIRPTSCHAFNDIYFESNSNERTVAVVSSVFVVNAPCEELGTELQATFDFNAAVEGSYIFRFWQGKDENDEDQYLVVEVPVI